MHNECQHSAGKKTKTKFVRLGSKHMFVNVPPSLRAKNQTDQANKDEPSSNQRDCSTNGQAHAHSEGMTKKGGKPAPPDAHDHVIYYVINTRRGLGGQVPCEKWVAVWRRSLRAGEEQRAGGSTAGASPAQSRVRAAAVWGVVQAEKKKKRERWALAPRPCFLPCQPYVKRVCEHTTSERPNSKTHVSKQVSRQVGIMVVVIKLKEIDA